MKAITTEILNAIKAAQTVLVVGHVRPDGDCVGSVMAMRHICEKLGKTADAMCDCDKPDTYAFLPEYEYFCAPRYKQYDLFISVDCATESRLGECRAFLVGAKNSINIDHHATNPKYCKINYVDGDACSTCYILYNMFKDVDGLLDGESAAMLYTGLSTDTGHFMHSNTTAEVFSTAAELCKYGIDIAALNRSLYCNNKFSKVMLTARALGGIILYEGGKIALMNISLKDLQDCGCTSEDTEGLINNASAISGVRIAISMCEQQGSVYRVSFRSAAADVAAAAAKFGGGGHRLAAGCMISGNRYDVMEKVVAAATAALNSERAD
ncbi:MAG: bifunctional oligoribonuclease/PAP phosphatase NrnA [Clostridiales bacterium]|nr:bifunctional oligoribonuclease/PAP phosphatase NrnA [Clostridiales bacterium]